MEKSGRKLKTHTSNTIHHVMIRGNNRQQIFFSKKYFEYFLKLLADASIQFDHRILAYCMMTNHVHLIIYIQESHLSKIMKNINYRYACWVNKMRNRVGHLFQGRYRSIEVNDEIYLINLCRYIHNNPVEAKMVKFPEEYPWSSHQYFLNLKSPEWISLSEIISAIQNKTNLSYPEFMKIIPNRNEWKPSLRFTEEGKIIVDDSVMLARDAGMKKKSAQLYKTLPFEVVLSEVLTHLDISLEQLQTSSRLRCLSRKRALITFYALRYSVATITEVAMTFNRDLSALHKQYIAIKAEPEKYFDHAILKSIEISLEAMQDRVTY